MLMLPPDHQIYPQIHPHEIGVEFEKGMVKSVWDKTRKRIEEQEKLSLLEKEVVPIKTPKSALNFTRIPATSWKNNKRVMFVENDDEDETARMLFVKDELMNVANKYVKENCDKRGKVLKSNFDQRQEGHLKSLKTRLESESLTVYETDKSGNFVVDTLDNLDRKMQKHLKNDKVVSNKEILKIEKMLNSETESWIDILQIGENVKHAQITKNMLHLAL